MLTARMAANEAGAIQSLRTYGSAQTAFAAVNNQQFGTLAELTAVNNGGFLDNRWAGTQQFNGYVYADTATAIAQAPAAACAATPDGFSATANPIKVDSTGRFQYGICSDQVVRYIDNASGTADPPKCGAIACTAGDPIGKQ
jgi:hypothetical protein